MPIGKGEIRRQGQRVALLVFGTLLDNALEAAEELNATVASMRFVKPMDEDLIRELARNHELLVTIEEGCIPGGAGAGVLEFLQQQEFQTPVLNLGIPDRYIEAAKHPEQLAECDLDKDGIIRSVTDRLGRTTVESIDISTSQTTA